MWLLRNISLTKQRLYVNKNRFHIIDVWRSKVIATFVKNNFQAVRSDVRAH